MLTTLTILNFVAIFAYLTMDSEKREKQMPTIKKAFAGLFAISFAYLVYYVSAVY